VWITVTIHTFKQIIGFEEEMWEIENTEDRKRGFPEEMT
jgi:hypothetical protein